MSNKNFIALNISEIPSLRLKESEGAIMDQSERIVPGIYSTFSMDAYLKLRAFSSGMACTILSESPLHCWIDSPWNPARVQDDSNVADIGSLAHDFLLEGGTDRICSIDRADYPSKNGNIPIGWSNKAIKEARDDARANGEIPVFKENVEAVVEMVKTAKLYIAGSEIAGVFDSGKCEQTILWNYNETLCKCRPDWLSDTALIHYKTTKASVNPRSFSRVCDSMGYDIVMMFYLRAALAVEPDKERQHYILAQEQDPPWSCKLFDLTSAKADVAERKVTRALDTWAACVAWNRWPAYDGNIFSIDLMPWELARAEEDILKDERSKLTDEELTGGMAI